MDKIWDRKSFEVGGRCGGDETTKWPRRTDKSRLLKKEKVTIAHICSDLGYHVCKSDTYTHPILICFYFP